MKKLSHALLFTVILLLLGGCRSRSELTLDGRPCYGLEPGELRILVETARGILLDNDALTKPEDKAEVRTREANVIISYVGDKAGTAKVTWDLPKRIVGVTFRGEFLTDRMRWYATTLDKKDNVIFAPESKLTPEQQKQMLRQPPRVPRPRQ